MSETGWVIEHLLKFGKTVVPNDQIEKYGAERIEEAILKAEGIKTKITRKEQMMIDPVSHRRVKDDDLYTIEIIE